MLAFRIGDGIVFRNLYLLSGMTEKDFFRLMYLFRCLGVISIFELRPEDLRPSQRDEKPARQEPERPAPQIERVYATDSSKPSLAVPPGKQDDLAQYYFVCAVKSFTHKSYWAAVEYCKKAIELKKDSKIYQLMGKALATHPAFRHEAMEAFKQALALDPFNVSVERDVADLYFASGSMALAKAKYEAFLKFSPDDEASKMRLQEIKKRKKGRH